ncbi:chromosome partitioning protein ParB [Paracoccus sp. MC1862]|uniref:chromosome partitioning protein ParB n=1 Tax=Paracoccus sp. MC1862 TaxID=2760307 RepID=UPI0015FFF93D|nr:chromosome partitioning protein ParB [Paracoccus sp. MC1862]MBB1499150.1 chromosome partitioning protein ParB [Paracoccus sp. MC1862]QQO46792.1 chromosome partitioning protein ParB [Paracoccus sp. MC1862]
MTGKPFSVDLGRLRSREKDRSAAAVERADRAGEDLGFIDRDPVKRRGRKPSPRTGQVHAKVLPHVAEAIAAEARRRGVQQGVVLEEAWALYQASQGDGTAG